MKVEGMFETSQQVAEQPLWTLDQAVELVRSLHGKLRDKNCTIALGGSCLHKGFSDKDVDIIIHPLDFKERADEFDWTEIISCLEDAGLTFIRNAKIAEYSQRHVEIWEGKDHKRIDVFFMDA